MKTLEEFEHEFFCDLCVTSIDEGFNFTYRNEWPDPLPMQFKGTVKEFLEHLKQFNGNPSFRIGKPVQTHVPGTYHFFFSPHWKDA